MLDSILSQSNTLLMWPSPDAEDLKSFLDQQRRRGATDITYTLIVLDGTWHQARSLYNQNSFLHSLKHVGDMLTFASIQLLAHFGQSLEVFREQFKTPFYLLVTLKHCILPPDCIC